MAAPAESPEQAFRLRRFAGVNTLTDPVFLGPQYLASSQNWVPNQTFRLSKKPGSRLYVHTNAGGGGGPSGVTNITAVGRYYKDGLRYLFWYCQRPSGSGNDLLVRTVEDTVVQSVTSFVEDEAIGRLIRYGNFLYVGNGIEPLKQIALKEVIVPATDVVSLGPIGELLDLGSVVATPIAGTDQGTKRLDTGSYQWAWAIYNTSTKLYTKRTDPQNLDVPVNTFATAISPAATLGTNEVYRFFVAPRGWPIEYATAQKKDWAASITHTFSEFEVTDDRVPVTNNVLRTGNLFTIYRGRVVFAGNADDPNAVCATGVLLPGLEQDVFNQGAFFPASARLPFPDRITAIGVAGSTGAADPRSPLVVATATKLYLCLGDPFDPQADFGIIQLSDRIGCPAHDTMVPTPHGLIFMSLDSVWVLGPDGSPPLDVGWPIADQIRTIGSDRINCCAIYHKDFYKLAIPIPGGGHNSIQWWLDLRQGIGTETPSWWGPHVGPPVSAFATALQDPDEVDKGFAAYAGTDMVFIHHQMNLYYEVMPVGIPVGMRSVLRTGVFDAEQPFLPKVFTRLRAIARAASKATLQVSLITDGGSTWAIDPMELEGPEGAKWYGTLDVANRARWAGTLTGDQSHSHWLHLGPLEIQTITPVERPRGLSVEVILTHDGTSDLQLRDFEVLFIPTGRKVRYIASGTTPGEKVPM